MDDQVQSEPEQVPAFSEQDLQQIHAAAKEKIKDVKEKSTAKLAALKKELLDMAQYAQEGDEERARLSAELQMMTEKLRESQEQL